MYRVETKPTKASYDWLEYALLTVCRKVFPSEAALRVHAIEPRMNRVFPHQDYGFRLECGDTEFRLILRLHQGFFSIWGGTEKVKSAKEFSVMRHIYQQGHSVPFAYAFDTSDYPFGCSYLILDPGDGSRWWEHSESLRTVLHEYVESLAEELARLHTMPAPQNPLIPRVDVYSLLRQIELRIHRLENDELQRCFRGCRRQIQNLAGYTPVLLHGSYEMDNVLIKNNRVRCITNWENTALGDPRWDVAHACLSLQRTGDSTLINRFLSRYVQLTDYPMEDLGFWQGLVSLRSFALSQWLRSLDTRSFEAIIGLQTNLFDHESEYREQALRQFG